MGGKDIQGIRGTNALSEDTGVYKWTMIWGHEPGRAGGGDAVGLGSELAEYFGPISFPCLGYPGGMSLGLYANGELVYNGKTVAELVGPPRKTPEEIKMALEGKSAAGSGNSEKGDSGGSSDGGGMTSGQLVELDEEREDSKLKLPRCNRNHELRQITSTFYCLNCYTYPKKGSENPFCCEFCQQSMCQKCYDKKLKSLNPEMVDIENKDEDEEEDDEEEKEQFRYAEYGNERSEEEIEALMQVLADGKKKRLEEKKKKKEEEEKKAQDLKSFLPEEFVPEERASLFGKGSKITLTLDTDKDGGRLS